MSKQKSSGIVDKFVENLPIELHLLGTYHPESYQQNDQSLKGLKPGKMKRMQYCGPGTKYDMRYARGDRGINRRGIWRIDRERERERKRVHHSFWHICASS